LHQDILDIPIDSLTSDSSSFAMGLTFEEPSSNKSLINSLFELNELYESLIGRMCSLTFSNNLFFASPQEIPFL